MSKIGMLSAVATAMAAGFEWEPPSRLPQKMGPGPKKTYRTRIIDVPNGMPFRAPKKTKPNDPCKCGSGLKHKQCRFKGLCKGEL